MLYRAMPLGLKDHLNEELRHEKAEDCASVNTLRIIYLFGT